ncbi:hypothetical protein CKO_01112 [Citrobacter koseri ATCC BAA-895]|uniref:Uncharacterized protein n=1 Tax=Citrobacter koseri (strain ATCC BAA-895 / CDC 4225-83 / SGSC4696) TaxID=290338 RepID=A8AFJ2_CITK8|nr:hypothetical protein CKO_01112 [Citrobacter koseri ATCC BAA-895]
MSDFSCLLHVRKRQFFYLFYGYLPRENRRTPESHGWISVYSFGIHVKAVQCIVIKLQLYPGKSTGIFN